MTSPPSSLRSEIAENGTATLVKLAALPKGSRARFSFSIYVGQVSGVFSIAQIFVGTRTFVLGFDPWTRALRGSIYVTVPHVLAGDFSAGGARGWLPVFEVTDVEQPHRLAIELSRVGPTDDVSFSFDGMSAHYDVPMPAPPRPPATFDGNDAVIALGIGSVSSNDAPRFFRYDDVLLETCSAGATCTFFDGP